jgi:hypothetical protein
MPYQTDMAERLRKDGLKVKEVEGWKSRGNSSGGNFTPRAFVVHHTAGAGPSAGKHPSLSTLVHGRSDLAGPLCNVSQDYEGTIYCVAAGAANHAGSGGWKGVSGNSQSFGIEIEHPGTYPLEDERAELAARAIAALSRGRFGAGMVCQHKEWRPGDKIDLATAPGPSWWRDRVAHYLEHPEVDDLNEKETKELIRSMTPGIVNDLLGVNESWQAEAFLHFAAGMRAYAAGNPKPSHKIPQHGDPAAAGYDFARLADTLGLLNVPYAWQAESFLFFAAGMRAFAAGKDAGEHPIEGHGDPQKAGWEFARRSVSEPGAGR